MSDESVMTQLQARVDRIDRVLDLTYGYPDGLMPSWIVDVTRELATGGWSRGHLETCAATICRYFAARSPGCEVTLTHSASEALLVAFDAALGEHGGEILMFDGTYDAYDGLARICRGRVHRVPRAHPTARPDIEDLACRIGGTTRALLLTQPENPLGWVHRSEQIERAAALACHHGLALIIDTAFADLAPGGRVPLPEPCDDLRLLVVGDTGKLVSLAGLRIGSLSHSRHFTAQVRAATSSLFLRIDPPRLATLAQILANPRLTDHRETLAVRLADNHRVFVEAAGPSVHCPRPEATSMAVASIPGLGLTDSAFTEALLAEQSVALVPLSLFFADRPVQAIKGACSARLTLARPEALIREAAERLRRFLDAHRSGQPAPPTGDQSHSRPISPVPRISPTAGRPPNARSLS